MSHVAGDGQIALLHLPSVMIMGDTMPNFPVVS